MSDTGHQQDEATSLRRYLDELKASNGMTQAEFAVKHAILGGPSMMSQHLSGNRPINLEQAIRYAAGFREEGLKCSIGLLSPRLAAEVNRAYNLERTAITGSSESLRVREPSNVAPMQRSSEPWKWPFPNITREEIESLSSDQRHIIESLVKELISGSALKSKHKTPAKKTTRR